MVLLFSTALLCIFINGANNFGPDSSVSLLYLQKDMFTNKMVENADNAKHLFSQPKAHENSTHGNKSDGAHPPADDKFHMSSVPLPALPPTMDNACDHSGVTVRD